MNSLIIFSVEFEWSFTRYFPLDVFYLILELLVLLWDSLFERPVCLWKIYEVPGSSPKKTILEIVFFFLHFFKLFKNYRKIYFGK
jgi:hypothetical protein